MGRPMLSALNGTPLRCATCKSWDPTTMGVGRCMLPALTDRTDKPVYVDDGGWLYTRLDFGCIFHDRAVES